MTVINKRCGQLGRTNMYLQSSTTVQDKKNFLAISHHSHVLPCRYNRRPGLRVSIELHRRGSIWKGRKRVTICCGCMLQFDHRWPCCPLSGSAKAKFKNFMSFSLWVWREFSTRKEQISYFLCRIEYFVGGESSAERSHLWSTKRPIWIFYWKFTAKIRDWPHPCGRHGEWWCIYLRSFPSHLVDQSDSQPFTYLRLLRWLSFPWRSVRMSVKVYNRRTVFAVVGAMGKATHYNSSIDVPLGARRVRDTMHSRQALLFFCSVSAVER